MKTNSGIASRLLRVSFFSVLSFLSLPIFVCSHISPSSLFLAFCHIILPSLSFSPSSRKTLRVLHLVRQARNAFPLLGVREISSLITALQVFPCSSNIAHHSAGVDCYVKISRAYRWQCMTEVCSAECDGAVIRVFTLRPLRQR